MAGTGERSEEREGEEGCADEGTAGGWTITGAEAEGVEWKGGSSGCDDAVRGAAAPPGVVGHGVWLVAFETEVGPGEEPRWTLFLGDSVGATLRPDPEP